MVCPPVAIPPSSGIFIQMLELEVSQGLLVGVVRGVIDREIVAGPDTNGPLAWVAGSALELVFDDE